MVAMQIFSFYWLLCTIVTFTSAIVLSYSEVLLQKVSFVRIGGPTKQVIKCKDLVKQRKYTDTNTSVRDVFRTQVNIYNGAFFAKIVNGFQLLTIFAKNLHHWCLTGFSIYLYQSLVSNKNGQNILINIYTKTLTWTNCYNNKIKVLTLFRMGKPVKRTLYPVFLTQVDFRQMPTWLPTWKAKSLYHVGTFWPTWFFCHFKSSKLSNQNQRKIPKPKQIGAYYKF